MMCLRLALSKRYLSQSTREKISSLAEVRHE